MKKITRKDAMSKGLRHYFTGEPCKQGHVAERIVDSCGCRQCRLESTRAKRLAAGLVPWSKDENERKARRKAALARYAERHPDRLKESQKKFKTLHPEKRKATVRRYDVENKDLRRLHAHKRRASKVGALSCGIADRLMRLQKGKCGCCKVALGAKYEIDHVIPLAKGGAHADANLQLLCPPCNRSKGAKHPVDFMRERGYLL